MIPNLTAHLEGLAGLAGKAEVVDTDTGPGPGKPSVWVTDAPTSYTGRLLNVRARGTLDAVRLVCTSSSAAGAIALAQYVAAQLDGARLDGHLLRVQLITEAVEDTQDPSAYRWSSTVDVDRQTPRGTPA